MKYLYRLFEANENEKLRARSLEPIAFLALSPKLLALSLIRRIYK